jgi:mono/diheme cytochrome c family protein
MLVMPLGTRKGQPAGDRAVAAGAEVARAGTPLHRRGRPARSRLLGGALSVLLGLSVSCRPASVLAPRASSGAAVPPGPAVDNAPLLALSESRDLDAYLADLLDNFAMRRAGRWGLALEPGELREEIVPALRSSRLQKDIDPIEAHFNAGEELFETELSGLDGFGDALGGKPPNFHRIHRGAHGGPDSTSCRSCHHRGGDDGAGEFNEAALTGGDGLSERNANERNPPALGGGGALQILAREITEKLQAQLRVDGVREAFDYRLTYQGVDFGVVRMLPGGAVDTSRLFAIDPDLVVRPFGWKGTHSTLRRFAEEAFQVHHGLQSTVLVDRRRFHGTDPRDSSPTTRALMRALGDGPLDDPDRDQGGVNELTGSHLSAIAVYLTLLPMPVIEPPRAPDLLAAWRLGGQVFTRVGCASCHKPSWTLYKPVWVEREEGDLLHPIQIELDLRKHIHNGPQLKNLDSSQPGYPLFIFSDLRRHDMGPELADRYDASHSPFLGMGPGETPAGSPDRQIPPSYFLTRPLWGLAETGPYMHDGRATTIDEAIRVHGGEADKARAAYLALPAHEQRALAVFLLSLTRPALPEVIP